MGLHILINRDAGPASKYVGCTGAFFCQATDCYLRILDGEDGFGKTFAIGGADVMLSNEEFQVIRQRGQIRWEWFEVRDLGNGLVGLWNPSSGRWLRVIVDKDGNGRVDSVSLTKCASFLDWWTAEFFQLFDAGGGHVGLYNPLTQLWVGASPDRKAVAIRGDLSAPSGSGGLSVGALPVRVQQGGERRP